MTQNNFPTILDTAIELLQQGLPTDEIISRYPEHADELRDLLPLAQEFWAAGAAESERALTKTLASTSTTPSPHARGGSGTGYNFFQKFRFLFRPALGLGIAVFALFIGLNAYRFAINQRSQATGTGMTFTGPDSAPTVKDQNRQEQSNDAFAMNYGTSAGLGQPPTLKQKINGLFGKKPTRDQSAASFAPLWPGGSQPSTREELIQNAFMELEVADVKTASNRIISLIHSHGGTIANRSEWQDNRGRDHASITMDIPAPYFEADVEIIKAFGEVSTENLYANNVAVDLDTYDNRLAEIERQLLNLKELRARAWRVADQANIDADIRRLEDERQNLSGARDTLKLQTIMSRLTVSLAERGGFFSITPNNYRPGSTLAQALSVLLALAAGLGRLLIWFIVFTPVWLAGLAVVALIITAVRRRRKRKHNGDVEIV